MDGITNLNDTQKRERLNSIMRDRGITDMMDYTVDSTIGLDIAGIYKALLSEVTDQVKAVYAHEISDGKYLITIITKGGKEIEVDTKAWDSYETVIESILYLSCFCY